MSLLDRLISLSGTSSDIIDDEENDIISSKVSLNYLKEMQTAIISKSESKTSIIYDPDIEVIQNLQPGELPPIHEFYKKIVYRVIPHKNFPKYVGKFKCRKCKQLVTNKSWSHQRKIHDLDGMIYLLLYNDYVIN
jgi:hypothetical protein